MRAKKHSIGHIQSELKSLSLVALWLQLEQWFAKNTRGQNAFGTIHITKDSFTFRLKK